MTFDRDDSYNLDFVFDRKAENRLSSTSDMAFTLNGLQVVDGDASAVAAAINAAVTANETDGDGGSDMTGIVAATAIGNVVQIVVSGGIDTEISAPAGTLSSGDGKIDIQYHAAQAVSEPAIAALQLEQGEIFQFRVNGQTVQVDSTAAGISAATGGTIAGVIADAADAIRNAAQSTSGVGTVTVTTANSLNGTSMIFDISDATGSPLVISGFDAVTAGDAYFLSGASVDTTLEDEVGAVEMVNDSAAVTQNGMIANAQSLPQLDDSFAARNFDLRLAGDAIEVVAVNGAEMTDVSASGSSLAKQRYRLSNMPGEDLIMLVSNDGARRVSLQYDMLPEAMAKVQREINIRVTDASEGTVEMFDVATGTSLATRTLDEEQRVSALEFDIAFTGVLQDDDAFLIGDNAAGIGDNRNIDRLLQLQTKDIFGAGSGGFQKVFSSTVAKLGAIVQSGGIAAEAAEALRDVSLEAESAYTGVNLDTEAANLIEQQQAYQASARVLATARELFDTLIRNL